MVSQANFFCSIKMLCINLKIKSTSQLQTKVKDQIITAHLLKREIGQIKIMILYIGLQFIQIRKLFLTVEREGTHTKKIESILLSNSLNQCMHAIVQKKGKASTDNHISQMDYIHSVIKREKKIENKENNQNETISTGSIKFSRL